MRTDLFRLTPRPRLLFTVSCLLISACSVGPDYKRPFIAVPSAFKEAAPQPQKAAAPVPGGPLTDSRATPASTSAHAPLIAGDLKKADPKDAAPRGKWWEVFSDKNLNALEEQVAINNQTVAASEAAFRQARALVAEARAAFFPTLGASASFTRNGNGGGSGRGGTGAIISNSAATLSTTTTGGTGKGYIINDYTASLDASWVPDIWGKIRREVESSKANAQASAAELASATLSMQAELAIDYLNLRLADEQKRILDRTNKSYARSLQITQNQYASGIAASSDVLQAKIQLETTEAQYIDVGVQRAEYEHAIAMLIGKAPTDFSIPMLNTVPRMPEIPAGVPSQLLERRPDIAASERLVAAANAQIGVAEAAFYPSLTLSASGGYSSSIMSQLFTLPSRFWSMGPSLAETLFDAGLRAAQTEAAVAAYDQAVANYRQTVLSAFQTTEDNLASLRILAEEASVLEGAVKDARTAAGVFLNQYKAGTVNYLSVVTAQAAELNDELSALNVEKARFTAVATLIENMGGGWDNKVLDTPDVIQGKTGIFNFLPPSTAGK